MSDAAEGAGRAAANRAAWLRLLWVCVAGAAAGAVAGLAWHELRPLPGWQEYRPLADVAFAVFGALAAGLTCCSLQWTLLATRPPRLTLVALPVAWCVAVAMATIVPGRRGLLLFFLVPPALTFATGVALYLRAVFGDGRDPLPQRARNRKTPPGAALVAMLAIVVAYAVFAGIAVFAYGLPAIGILGAGTADAVFGAYAPTPIVALFPVVWLVWTYRLRLPTALLCIVVAHAVSAAVVLLRAGRSGIESFPPADIRDVAASLPWLSLALCVVAWFGLRALEGRDASAKTVETRT